MKIFRKYFALLVIVFGISVQCFGHNLEMAYDKSQTCDNYYVPPGGVYIAQNEIFVLFDGKLIQVDMLCADANGVFVPAIEMGRRQLVWCPHCNHWIDPTQPHDCKGPA